jgi:hypothetical protein
MQNLTNNFEFKGIPMRLLTCSLFRSQKTALTPERCSLQPASPFRSLAFLSTAAILFCGALAHAAGTATVTNLVLTSGSSVPVTTVTAGTAVTLTASVKAGATALTAGQVFFCDTSVVSCGYSVSLGSAQLTSAGSAKLIIIPAPGSHTYKAVFTGTASNAASTSANVNLAVTASIATSTTVTASGTAPYTLISKVTGIAANWPTGTVTLTDTTNSFTLGKQTLVSNGSLLDLNAGAAYPLPPASDFIISGDFNGDGKLDLAVAVTRYFPDDGIEDGVAILLGNGDGSFTAASTVGLTKDSFVESMVVGDFNGDGKLDLATANNGLNSVTILLGNGDGTFTAGSSPAAGNGPISIVTADFNRDGHADLAVANYSGPITILLGNGDGTFTVKNQTLGANSFGIVVADLNGDGFADLAVADGASYLDILLGKGDGTFSLGTPANTVDGPSVVVTGDFNGDGKADLAAVNTGGSTSSLTVLLGNGDGTFTAGTAPAIDISTNSYTGFLASADFNGDGKSDLVLLSYDKDWELISQGDGSFAEITLPGATTGPNYYTVTTGDFNGDGLADIATQNSDTALANIYLNQQSVTATATLTNVVIPGSGNHTVQAAYGGNTEFASSSKTFQLSAASLATKLSLTANPTAPAYGAQVLLTATLAPYSDGTLLTNGETVTFLSNGSAIGTGKLTSGVATFNISSLPAGSDSITATYPGDSNFAAATSAAVNVVVATPQPAAVTLSPASLTFAAQPVGTTSAAQSLTLTDSGQSTLNLTSIVVSGPFAETNTCGTSVAPTASCQISVTYSPTSAQNDSGAITITDNATGSPHTVALSGTGSALNLSPSSTQLTITSPGASATDNLQIASNNGFSGTVSLTCAVKFTGTGTANDAPVCSLSPSSVTVSSGTTGSTTLTVTSTAATASLRGFLLPSGTALAALTLCGFLPRRRWRGIMMVFLLGVVVTAAFTGCGGSSKSSSPKDSGTTTGSYSVTVTATSGSFTTTTPIPLTVQ